MCPTTRYAYYLRYPNKEAVNAELFGARGTAAAVDLPSHLDYFANALPVSAPEVVNNIINKHTLFPFYAPFLSVNRIARLKTDMKGSNGSALHKIAGINPSNIRKPNWLRFCPVCADEDKKQFGERYWHRIHQIPGVEVCSAHSVFLQDSQVPARNQVNKAEYFSADLSIRPTTARKLKVSDGTHQVLLDIAGDVAWLLNQQDLAPGLIRLRSCHLRILAENALCTNGWKIRVRKLLEKIKRHYRPALLRIIQCDFDESLSYSWPCTLVKDLKREKIHHPLRHLLLLHLFGHTAESFFARCLSEAFSDEVIETAPFGEGPWPCLNPTCDDFQELTISECQVIYLHKQKTPAGIFCCACGFEYARKGPDLSGEDQFRRDWIRAYGPVWEKTLRCYWKDLSMSIHKMAPKLGVAHNTVKYQAMRLRLKFPRKGIGPKVARINPKLQRQFKEEERAYGIKRKSNRQKFLAATKKYPKASRRHLSVKLGFVYWWLWRNDREWLMTRLPPPFKRIGSARQVDWKGRDTELARQVRCSALKLKNTSGFPTRITKSAIGRDLDRRTLLLKGNYVKKLPLTFKALKESVESLLEYAIRRVQWAEESFRQENQCPSYPDLARRARLSHRIWYISEIHMAINSALYSLSKTNS